MVGPAQVGARAGRWLPLLLVAICLAGMVDWLSVETRRLYVEDAIAARQQGTVWQHFGIRDEMVVPQIVTKDDARFVFSVNLSAPHRLVVALKPKGAASFEIYWNAPGGRTQIASEKIEKNARRSFAIPRGAGELEFSEHGSVAWQNLRLERSVFLWPVYAAAAFSLAFLLIDQLRARNLRVAEWLTLAIALLVTLAIVESLLRHYRRKLPPVIIAARHDLGVVGQDSRWIDPARYKMRLRANLNTYAEWREGDITRLGFIQKDVTRPVLHRYPIRTDAEGFRNAVVREKIDIAALGDSFTDGTTSAVEDTWPARLAVLTGKTVQNYGTSGFGPQQAHYVFQDFVRAKRPRWTVLGFFAANDLNDAEVFERWERGDERPGEELSGWKLPPVFRRYETFHLWTILRVASNSLRGPPAANEPARIATHELARFHRGMFHVPVGGRALQFAFFPPYLQKLGRPREEIERTRGWELTTKVLRKLKAECEQDGSTLIVMVIPAKEQVYWPLVERTFTPETLQEAINFYCRYNNMPLRLADVRANLLEQNALLGEFCASEGIRVLDLTEALRAEVAAGRETFFPDDTHWNTLGHEVAARELAKALEAAP